jgi:hypothetical protein
MAARRVPDRDHPCPASDGVSGITMARLCQGISLYQKAISSVGTVTMNRVDEAGDPNKTVVCRQIICYKLLCP